MLKHIPYQELLILAVLFVLVYLSAIAILFSADYICGEWYLQETMWQRANAVWKRLYE